MTNEEAIRQLKYCKSIHNGSFGPAIKIAIKALEREPKTEYKYCPNCGAKMEVINEKQK